MRIIGAIFCSILALTHGRAQDATPRPSSESLPVEVSTSDTGSSARSEKATRESAKPFSGSALPNPPELPSSIPSSAILEQVDRDTLDVQLLFGGMDRPSPVTPPMADPLEKNLKQAEEQWFSARREKENGAMPGQKSTDTPKSETEPALAPHRAAGKPTPRSIAQTEEASVRTGEEPPEQKRPFARLFQRKEGRSGGVLKTLFGKKGDQIVPQK